MEDLQCRIVTSNYQLFVSGKKKKKTYFSTNKKHDPLHIQKDLQMPQHSYLPANISFLCFVGHQGWIIHEPPFQMLIVSGGKGSARSASGKLQRFAAGTVLCAIQGPAACSLELLEQRMRFQWPQLWRQLFAHSLWWQKCVVGFPLTACTPPHTHTLTHSHAMHHTSYHQGDAKKPHDLGTRMSDAPQFRIALYLVWKIIG